ncbi:MAG: zf-HC2 domain-containing protein [Candidatus Omnitrophota bacterium]
MKCKKCQEHLLTGYLDNEIPEETRKKVESHLASCSGCRKFFSLAGLSVEPFKGSQRNAPPERVWQGIKERINAEDVLREGRAERLWQIIFPKPAAAFALFALLVSAGIFFNIKQKHPALVKNNAIIQEAENNGQDLPENVSDEIDFVAYLLNDDDSEEEYSPAIERYFL